MSLIKIVYDVKVVANAHNNFFLIKLKEKLIGLIMGSVRFHGNHV